MKSNIIKSKVLAHKELKWCWYMNDFNIEIVAMLSSLTSSGATFEKL